ncbi:MAG: hypothetical protein V5A47_08695 [Bacteroidales bacterium]
MNKSNDIIYNDDCYIYNKNIFQYNGSVFEMKHQVHYQKNKQKQQGYQTRKQLYALPYIPLKQCDQSPLKTTSRAFYANPLLIDTRLHVSLKPTYYVIKHPKSYLLP